jgi:hypothetical protein
VTGGTNGAHVKSMRATDSSGNHRLALFVSRKKLRMQSQAVKFEFGRFVSVAAGVSIGLGITTGTVIVTLAALLQMAGGF